MALVDQSPPRENSIRVPHGFSVSDSVEDTKKPIIDNGTTIADALSDGEDEAVKKSRLRAIYKEITSREFSARQRFYHIVHGTPVLTPDDIIAVGLNTFIILMVIASTVTFIVETMPDFYEPDGPKGVFFTLETIWVAIFTADLVVRCASATKIKHVANLQMLFDFLSIIGYYITLGVDTSGNAASFQLLRMLRLTRVLRMSKLSRSGLGFSMMTQTIRRSKQGLLLLVLLVAIAMVLCAAVIYSVEAETGVWDDERRKWYFKDGEESPFQSIPSSFWFVLLTLTTVGYGDEVPSQGYGRAVAVGIMVFGVLLLSFPNILIGSNFQSVHDTWQRQRARNALGRRFRFVRYGVRFIRMWRDFRRNGQMRLLRVSSHFNVAGSFAPRGDGSFRMDDTVAAFEERAEEKKHANLYRRTLNFMFRSVDFAEFDYSQTFTLLNQGKLDAFTVRGLETVQLLQRLVQVFSCCCTIEEMYEFLLLEPVDGCSVKQCDLVEIACHLANATIVELYVLNRFDDHMLMHITQKGIKFLQHFGEDPNLHLCIRGFAEAKEIWKQTTGAESPTIFPLDGFRRWQEVQATVPKRSRMAFVFDLKNPESKTNSVFRSNFRRGTTNQRQRRISQQRSAVAGMKDSSNSRGCTSSAATTGGCSACLHCVTQLPLATESDLNRLEEYLMLQRRLVEEYLEVVSLRRERARKSGIWSPPEGGVPILGLVPAQSDDDDADVGGAPTERGTGAQSDPLAPPGAVPEDVAMARAPTESPSTYNTSDKGSDERADQREGEGRSPRRHSWDVDIHERSASTKRDILHERQ